VSRLYGDDEGAVPTDYNGLVKAFPEWLALATPEQPLIIFLDALDQLSRTDNAHLLAWLPTELPPHVRLVVSTLPSEALDALARRGTPPLITDLPVMPPEEGRAVLEGWLSEAHRTLQEHQREEVLTKFNRNGLPLYLRLAFEEARRWRSYTPYELHPDLHGIITDLFDRLESPAQHGQLFVAHCLGYLAAARRGLTEDELLDVLSRDEEVFDDFTTRAFHTPPEPRLPVVVWSRLFFDLEPYLTERRADQTSLIGFYHRALAEAAAARYLADVKEERHKSLARYFGDRSSHPLFKDAQRRMPDHRVASELPYQQRKGTLWEELENTLTDLHFVEAKCAAGMTYDLITDYVRAREVLPEAREELQEEREREEAAQRYGAELTAYAKAHSERRLRERAQGTPTTADEPTSEAFGIAKRLRDRFARRPRDAHRDQQELDAPFPRSPVPPSLPISSTIASDRNDEHSSVVNDSASSSPHITVSIFHQFVDAHSHLFTKFADIDSFCIQNAYNYADAGPVAEQAQRIITTERSTIPLLLRINRPALRLKERCLKTLEGHTSWVKAVSMTPDGRRAVSGSDDHTVRVWDLETGECERVLEGHTDTVYAVRMTPDGRRVVSGSQDNTVRVWDLETGECERVLEGPNSVNAVSITPDGRRAVSGGSYPDNTVRVWDLETGECERVLERHHYSVNAVSITPDGRRAVSGSDDHTVRVWDLETGECERVLEAHHYSVNAVSITPDGRRAVSGGRG
jgi:NACHT domain- and WD repeat-containing protein